VLALLETREGGVAEERLGGEGTGAAPLMLAHTLGCSLLGITEPMKIWEGARVLRKSTLIPRPCPLNASPRMSSRTFEGSMEVCISDPASPSPSASFEGDNTADIQAGWSMPEAVVSCPI